jgi:hypothetical protein
MNVKARIFGEKNAISVIAPRIPSESYAWSIIIFILQYSWRLKCDKFSKVVKEICYRLRSKHKNKKCLAAVHVFPKGTCCY